jgi:hypothetical protein
MALRAPQRDGPLKAPELRELIAPTVVSLFFLASASCDGRTASPPEGSSTTGARTQAATLNEPATTTAPGAGAAELTSAELRAMVPSGKVLRREGHSRNYKILSSFYTSNQDAAQQSQLPNLDRADLAAGGRVSGYAAGYVDGCGGTCFPGLLNVSTEVHVFTTAAQASRFIADQRVAYPSLEGKPFGTGH